MYSYHHSLSLSLSVQAFAKQFNTTPDDLDMHVIYDVSHNIAKVEEHISFIEYQLDVKYSSMVVLKRIANLELNNVMNILSGIVWRSASRYQIKYTCWSSQ